MKFMEPDDEGELTPRDFSDFDKDRYAAECVRQTGCTLGHAAPWLAEELGQDWKRLEKKYGLESKLEALPKDEDEGDKEGESDDDKIVFDPFYCLPSCLSPATALDLRNLIPAWASERDNRPRWRREELSHDR